MSAKIFIHVGFPKCGSTSLQHALAEATGITFPTSGRHGVEHLSVPLYLKGIDPWTAKWFSPEWVAEEHRKLMGEIGSAPGDVVISSERLASLRANEIQALKKLFDGWSVEIIFVTRDIAKYLDSTWRHAVFRHDYAGSREEFLKKMAGFTFGRTIALFEGTFPVHVFNMDEPNFSADLSRLIGIPISIGHSNIGVPGDLALLLQKTHALMGSALFKAAFPPAVKESMRRTMVGETAPDVDEFTVPLF